VSYDGEYDYDGDNWYPAQDDEDVQPGTLDEDRPVKNIYVLNRAEAALYNEAEGFVVVAGDEQQARQLAARRAGEEGRGYWLRPDVTVVHIGTAFERIAGQDIVLRAFNAG
jgi:hypothetical protein